MNASEARKAAEAAASGAAAAEIDKVMRAVQSAIAAGKMATWIQDMNLSAGALARLESEGYKVKNHDDQRDGMSVEVHW